MLSNQLFVPRTLQFVWFFGPTDFKPFPLAAAIADKLKPIFSVDPDVNSFPPGMPIPPEFPRITLKEPSVGQVTVTYERADLVLNANEETSWWDQLSSHIETFGKCLETQNINVVRLGFVLVCEINSNNSANLIRERYISTNKMDNAPEIQVGWLEKIDWSSYALNKWVRFTGITQDNLHGSLIIDLNTDPNRINSLSSTDVKNIIEHFLDQYRSDIDGVISW